MAWETRGNGQYYYQKRREGQRVRSQYVGAGEVAKLIAQLNEIDTRRRKFEQDVHRAELAKATRLDGPIDEFCKAVFQITEVVLVATGHHLHKRQWRKKRVSRNEQEARNLGDAMSRAQNNKASKADKAMVTKFIRETPNGWMVYGDLYRNAIHSTVGMLAGKSQTGEILATSLEERVKALQADFGYSISSPIERLLIEAICINWLRVWWLENIFSQNYEKMSLSNALHYEKRLSLSHNRFNRSIEILARVRRLARRTPEILQVNIAQQQVNTVSS
jgi:hypothetical protein